MRKSDLDVIARIPPKMAKRKWDFLFRAFIPV